jgi:hypothetical protein
MFNANPVKIYADGEQLWYFPGDILPVKREQVRNGYMPVRRNQPEHGDWL